MIIVQGWTPVILNTEDALDKNGAPYIRIHATVSHGEQAGREMHYMDALYRSPKAEPIARRKLHGILGRSVSSEEFARMAAWELHNVAAWAFVVEDRPGIARVLPWTPNADACPDPAVAMSLEPGEYCGWHHAGWYDAGSWAFCPETFSRWLYPEDWYDEIWEEALSE